MCENGRMMKDMDKANSTYILAFCGTDLAFDIVQHLQTVGLLGL
jgi:hypothetical protein